MSKRMSVADLPKQYQDQVAKSLYSDAVKPVFEDRVAKAVRLPVARPIRQSAGGLNKLEAAFLGHLKATEWPAAVFTQVITLKIANGSKYTPDFVVVLGIDWGGATVRAYEVKGFMRDDACVKLKVAASLYPWIAFHLVTRKKGVWQITPVLP